MLWLFRFELLQTDPVIRVLPELHRFRMVNRILLRKLFRPSLIIYMAITAIPEPEPFAKVNPSELKETFRPNQLV